MVPLVVDEYLSKIGELYFFLTSKMGLLSLFLPGVLFLSTLMGDFDLFNLFYVISVDFCY